jgi:hypothetical protein
MPVAVTRNRKRIDRGQRHPGRAQRSREQAFGGLDRDGDRFSVGLLLLGEHAHQLAESGCAVIDPHPDPLRACLVDDADIVVVFCPVNPAPQLHWWSFLSCLRSGPAEVAQRPNDEASTGRHRISRSRLRSLHRCRSSTGLQSPGQ